MCEKIHDKGSKVVNWNVEVPFYKIVLLFIAGCAAGELKYENFRVVTTGNLVGAKCVGGPNPHSSLDIYRKLGSGETRVYHYDGFAQCTVDDLFDSERMLLAMLMVNTLLKQTKM